MLSFSIREVALLWGPKNSSFIWYNACQEECAKTLWRTIDGAHDRDKIDKICADIEKSNHAMKSLIDRSNNNGGRNYNNIPWLLTEQQRNDVKEIVRRIKFPTGFSSNINNILTKKGDFSGVKTHD